MASKRVTKASRAKTTVKKPAKLLVTTSEKPLVTVESILLSMFKQPNVPLVTSEQARSLARLQIGTTTLMTPDTKQFLYEIIWMLHQKNYDVVYTHLNQEWQLIFQTDLERENPSIDEIRIGILFTSPLLDNERKKAIIDLETYRQKVEAREGLYECRCGSSNTRSFERQIRSADEPAAIFVVCQDCLRTWREQ
jgi:DNA-directed RNA polymerase subunit M/transcription elongation factor TFIIS